MIELVERNGRLVGIETEPRKEWMYGDYIKFEGDFPSKEEWAKVIKEGFEILKCAKMRDIEILSFTLICKPTNGPKTLGWKVITTKELPGLREGLCLNA